MRVCVLYNNPGTSKSENISEADDDTSQSARQVGDALFSLGYEPTVWGIDQKDIDSLRRLEADLVFNMIEWSGRETDDAVRAIAILEEEGIKFTGCGSGEYGLSSDKAAMKMAMVGGGIPTPRFAVIGSEAELDFESGFWGLRFPVIVKPALEHCAIGISQDSVRLDGEGLKLKARELMEKFQRPVIVEEFIDGWEAHVTVLERRGRPWVLPPAVFEYKRRAGYWGVMTYEAKWSQDSWETEMTEWVEDVGSDLEEKICKIARRTFERLGGRTHSRVDMRIRGEEIWVLEINHNPGLGWDEDSGMTYSCKKAGLDFRTLIETMVNSCI